MSEESDPIIYANPFFMCAQLVRDLRDRFLAEAGFTGGDRVLTPRIGELLGGMAGLATHCERMGRIVERLEREDAEMFEAFERAQGQP